MVDVGSVGHTLAAAGFLALTAACLWVWRGRVLAGALALGAIATTLWAVIHSQGTSIGFGLAYGAEIIRFGAWLGVLLLLLDKPQLVNAPSARVVLRSLGVLLGVVLVAMLLAALAEILPVPEALAEVALLRQPLPYLVMAVIGGVLVEQLYRNTHADRRWAIKPFCIGLGAVFAYDIYLYAEATLFGGLYQPLWEARGFVNTLVLPLFGVSLARSRAVSQPITVSRQLLFHSVVLLATGVYLLIMAAAGYYIRYFGGTWGAVLQVAFLFGALVVLLGCLLSGSIRAKLKVLFSKHLLRYRYDYRAEWLRFIDTLSATDVEQPLRERAIAALARIMESPRGLLFSCGEDGQFRMAASWNFGEPEPITEPADGSLPVFLARWEWVIDLEEYRENPDRYPGLELPSWLRELERAWLIVPMIQLERLHGFVVLGRPRALRRLNWEDHDLLKTAGRQLASYIGLLDTTDALIASRQFEAYNRLSAYVVHDLKNVSAQLGLVTDNAHRHQDNPEFVADAMETVASAKARMDRILAHLRRGDGEASQQSERFALDEALSEVVDRCRAASPVPVVESCPPSVFLTGGRESFVTALEHLTQNAQEATAAEGSVRLRVHLSSNEVTVTVADTGSGMDSAFIRDRLFRPFETTKGNAGMGIGVFEAREVMRSMGGELNVHSVVGEGSNMVVRLPVRDERPTTDGRIQTGGEQAVG